MSTLLNLKLYHKLLCFLLLSSFISSAQHNDSQAALYNIASGAVIGVWEPSSTKTQSKVWRSIIKGISQGALGGYVVFESKRLVGNFAETGNYAYVWPSKILNAAGNSIVLNATTNRNLWENYYLNISFIHLRYDFKSEKPFKIRLLPYSLVSAAYGFTQGWLDVKRTLYTGQLFFVSHDISDEFRGLTFANHIMLSKTLYEFRKNTIAHEIIHTYQYEGLMGTNAFFTELSGNIHNSKIFGKRYGKLFYTDWNGIISGLNHGAHLLFNVPYESRFYEKEAAYYSGPR